MQVFEHAELVVRVEPGADGAGRIELAGELDLSSASIVGQAFDLLLEAGCTSAVVDCAALAYLDSSGVSALLRGNQALGGDRAVRLEAVDAPIRRILDVLALDQVLDLDG